MNLLTDNAMMLSVKAGDLDKMGLLFERHHRALYNFFYYMTGRRESSEDMVQNVFFRMLKYRHTFSGEGEFRTWMYHLGRNVLKDFLKKNKRSVREVELTAWQENIGGGIPAHEQLEREAELKVLRQAMGRMTLEYREVIILSRFQELKYQEIARILDISEGAVKVRVHRAMNELKTIYLKAENKQESP